MTTLGDFGLESLVPIASAAITAGANVGTAFINADAQQYAAREAEKASLVQSLAAERVAIARANADVQVAQIQAPPRAPAPIAPPSATGGGGVVLGLLFVGLAWLLLGGSRA